MLLAEASIPSDSVKNATGEARLGVYLEIGSIWRLCVNTKLEVAMSKSTCLAEVHAWFSA